MQRIAVLGGSFNPPHLGHLMIISTLLSDDFDKLIIVPVGNHPFEKPLIPFKHRKTMIEQTVSIFHTNAIEVSELENIKNNKPTTTYETIVKLEQKYPNAEFTLIIGEDNVATLNSWYKWEELQQKLKIKVLKRDTYKSTVNNTDIIFPNISSAKIRQLLYSGENIEHYVPSKVNSYIKQHKLYLPTSTKTVHKIKWGVVGAGKVGSSIINSMLQVGILPEWIVDKQVDKLNKNFLDNIPKYSNVNDIKDFYNVDLVIYASSDSYFPVIPQNNRSKMPYLFHTGGMINSKERFKYCNKSTKKKLTGITHPLLAISSDNTDLRHAIFGFEGSTGAFEMAQTFFKPLAIRFLKISPSEMLFYHTLAALAANGIAYMNVTLQTEFEKLTKDYNLIGEAIFQLMHTSLQSMSKNKKNGLTGPLARKDWNILISHLKILAEVKNKNIFNIYVLLLDNFIKINKINIPEELSILLKTLK